MHILEIADIEALEKLPCACQEITRFEDTCEGRGQPACKAQKAMRALNEIWEVRKALTHDLSANDGLSGPSERSE